LVCLLGIAIDRNCETAAVVPRFRTVGSIVFSRWPKEQNAAPDLLKDRRLKERDGEDASGVHKMRKQ
jgi:hypothetical protein